MRTQAEKAAAFRALHERPGGFIIPNPWDAGTARLLASLGFEALATTSLGLANMLGRPDGERVSRDEVLENCRHDRGGDRPAGQRRPRERLRRRAQGRGRDDPARRRGRRGRRLDRGRHRRPAQADLRLRAGGRARRRPPSRWRASLPVPFMLTARAENLAAGPHRSRRHDPAAAGVRGGRRRRALRARAPGPRDHPHRGAVGRQAGERGDDRVADPPLTAAQLAERRRQAHQRRRRAVAPRARRLPQGRARDEGARRVHLRRRRRPIEGAQGGVRARPVRLRDQSVAT